MMKVEQKNKYNNQQILDNASYPTPTEVPKSPAGAFISINDNFEVGTGTAPFSVVFTGGTYSGFNWIIANGNTTITLTYING